MNLAVGNLPSNKLALTNRVYVSPAIFGVLMERSPPEVSDQKTLLVMVGGTYPYMAESNPQVSDEQLALNGLQRRFLQVSLGTPVEMSGFRPPSTYAMASLVITVDLLVKRSVPVSSGGRGKKPGSNVLELDTERLASTVLINYERQPFAVGMVFAMDFEGTKLEMTISALGNMSLRNEDRNEGGGGGGGKKKKKKKKTEDGDDDGDGDGASSTPPRGGLLVGPTDVMFQRAETATGSTLALIGSRSYRSGGGGPGGTNSIFLSDFDFAKLGIGGLDSEFNQIFRRAFASRIWPSKVIREMGINHVRGMLLYGPPGCGKTLIARQIGKVLNAREPKIVNGPEILNKFVGGSEEKIRELFEDAEKEQLEQGDHSMLHIIILDEMDAICKQRGSTRDGTGVSDSVVNQLLSKIDGVDSLNNILLIGMTNRKDMIDDALLRPGRLEVHVEIGLPDELGRLQILNIHTKNMRESKRVTPDVVENLPILAQKSKNFSGAELEGLVKAASSYALTRCVDINDLTKSPDVKNLVLRYEDFERALDDVEPKFGAKSQELMAYYRNGIVPYDDEFVLLTSTMQRLVEQVRTSSKTPLMSVLLRGRPQSGKTALAARMAVESQFPFVRMISADEMIGHGEMSKSQTIHRVFMDSYKSPLSFIFVDDIERIIDYVPIGPRFSNTVLQTLLVLLKKIPPDEGRRLLVVGTTSCPEWLSDLGLTQAFSVARDVPLLDRQGQISEVLRRGAGMSGVDADIIASSLREPIGIKQLLLVAEMARQGTPNQNDDDDNNNNGRGHGDGHGTVSVKDFMDCLRSVGYSHQDEDHLEE